VHPDPEHALSDGAQSLTFDIFSSVMENVAKIATAVGKQMERTAVAA
jgi:3-deoxy-7-phosphoheptulonate synthase